MINKIQRYISYLSKFASNPDKKELLKQLNQEMLDKGFAHGTKSFLHKQTQPVDGSVSVKTVYKKHDRRSINILPATQTPKVSIIIPVYNQLDHTLDCILSIFENSGYNSYEIIIADDNSTADMGLIGKCFQNIRIIRNQTNLGFLKNCNHAAKQAKGDYLVFLNNDTYVLDGWLSELLDVFNRFDKVGLVGSKLVYPNGKLQEAGGVIWQDGSGWNCGNRDEATTYKYNYTKEADYVSGASLMITRELWDRTGGFDEQFAPAYCEDSDLCFKVRAAGYKVMYEPYSVVLHFEGVSHGRDLNAGAKRHQLVNQKLLAGKWQAEIRSKSKSLTNVFYERDRSMGKKHVLVVDHYLPQVDKDAGSRTISNFMQALKELDYGVHFLGENQDVAKHYRKYYQQMGVEVLYGTEFYFSDQCWRKYLLEHLNDFDAILLSRASISLPFILFLRAHNYPGKIIYYGHDLGYKRLKKEARAKSDEALEKHAVRIKAAEDYLYQNSDYALVISDEEAGYLSQYVVNPLRFVPPYFFDIQHDTPPFDKKEGLLFVGGYSHTPNQDAMKWFLSEVYAPLHKQGIKLTVAGSNMPVFIGEYKEQFPLMDIRPDVTVAELGELYNKARVAIAPLRYGAGVKGKVIEAMSKGVPVAGTTVAFEGMPKDGDFPYRVADTAEAMVEVILKVYNGREEWQQLSSFGKKYVATHFNKDAMKQVFREIIEDRFLINARLRSLAECREHQAEYAPAYAEIARIEESLREKNVGSKEFTVRGFSYPAQAKVDFLVDFLHAPKGQINWRERVVCPITDLNSRLRACIHFIGLELKMDNGSKVYIGEQLTSLYSYLRYRFANITGSEYLGPDVKPGAVNAAGIRHEDATQLSFGAGELDYYLSFECFEHIPDYLQAFREAYRVLKPGGMLYFTVPFSDQTRDNLIRATMNADGTINHILAPEYHGDPVNPEGGILCFTHFGWQMFGQLRDIGFSDAYAITFWSDSFGYYGRQYLFFARK